MKQVKRGKTDRKTAKSKKAGKKVTRKTASARPAKAKAAKATSAQASPKTKPAKTALPASGPVTLDEAKALASARRPKLATRAVTKTARPPGSPAALGAERQKLEKERRDEREKRIRDYKAVMSVMKARGARQPRSTRVAKAKNGEPSAKGGSFAPLQIFAEGDSWFDYPAFIFKGGIIPRLEDRLGVPILNLAKAGDEVRYMLGVKERTLLAEQLTNGCPAGGPWDVLLFSGGGNDIVDNPMALWVRDWRPGQPPVSHLEPTRFAAALALVRAGYEDLITLRDQLSPNTVLVFHGYDFALPDGRGICNLGPWLKPTFDLRKFPPGPEAAAVVKVILQQFAAMLTALATRPKVTFINGQGTLAPQPSSWHNELHPTQAGFETFADLFQSKLKVLFPGRVA